MGVGAAAAQKRGEKLYKWDVEAVGRESFYKHTVRNNNPGKLDTRQAHSYKMEALAVLAGLIFLRKKNTARLERKGGMAHRQPAEQPHLYVTGEIAETEGAA